MVIKYCLKGIGQGMIDCFYPNPFLDSLIITTVGAAATATTGAAASTASAPAATSKKSGKE